MANNNLDSLLKQLNSKSKKKFSMNDLESLASGYSKNDIHNDKKIEDLIKKVASAAGVRVSNSQMSEIKKRIAARFSK